MFLTVKFKLHNVSTHKREVLMHAFEQYTLGYSELIEWARENETMLRENGQYCTKSGKCSYTGRSISALLPKPSVEIHSSMKDSLLQDVAANIASYFELGENAGFPVSRSFIEDEIDGALEYFINVGANEEDYNLSRDKLLKRSNVRYMPISFCRADGATRNRNFSLLANTDKRQLLAALWLLPFRHEMSKPLNAKQGNLIRLDTGEVFTSNSSTAILVPLQMGRNGWQESKFIEPALNGQASIKTGRLLFYDNEFYLAVAFEFEEPEPYKPEAYLGVDRGVFFSMAYAIIDSDGDIIKMVAHDDGFRSHTIQASRRVQEKQRSGKRVSFRDYKRKEGETLLHKLVNEIIHEAIEHKAMIVFEDLNIKIRGSFYKSAWKKMYKFTEYKCRLAGVPLWHNGVFAANSSKICIYCGELNHGRKRDGSPFSCPHCGAEYNSDAGAGVNIARRALYRKKDWEALGGYREFHRSFSQS